MRQRGKYVLLWSALIAWTVLMFYLSLQNEAASGDLSLGIVDRLIAWFPFLKGMGGSLETILRKAAHFAEFAMEGALIGCVTLRLGKGARAQIIAVLACAALAALNEFAQTFAEGRSCELRDMAIDFAGAMVGLLICYGARRLYYRKEKISDKGYSLMK